MMQSRVDEEFRDLWDRAGPAVRRYMFCACRSEADADDLTQECFLRALKAWDQLNCSTRRLAWLFAIARHTRADWFRRSTGRAVKTDLGSCVEVEAPRPDHDAEQLEHAWEAIKHLTDEQAEAIRLRFAAGLAYAEMAETLGVPAGTVRSRLYRALKALRNLVEEREHDA